MSNTVNYLGKEYAVVGGYVTIDSDRNYLIIKNQDEFNQYLRDDKPSLDERYFIDCNIVVPISNTIRKISNCVFNKEVALSNCEISNTEFTCKTNITSCIFGTELVRDNIIRFNEDANFHDGAIISSALYFGFSVGTARMDNKWHYNIFTFAKKANFENVYFEKEIELFLNNENNENAEIIFSNCKFYEKFKIRNIETNNYEEDQKTKAALKSLKIIDCTVNTKDNAYLRIGFLKVANFELKNLRLPQNAELNIGDCHFKNFTLANFRNIGKFKLFKINLFQVDNANKANNADEIKGNSNFQIDNTSIGDADFQSVNLSSFEALTLFDNIFNNVKYTNINWGEFSNKKEIQVKQFNENEIFKLEKQQDTYRTLKNVATANNDQLQAIKFHAKEMEKYTKLVRKNPSVYSVSDKITLYFNKWTNNFGLNWGWQFVSLIIFAIFMYCLLIYSLDGYYQERQIFGKFFEFLIPTHKLEFVAKGGWSSATYAIDFIFRFFEILMIYQIIQAFRKYSKK